MAALWEVKQHLVVHLAAHINDSCMCVLVYVSVMPSDYVAYHLAVVCVNHFSHSHAQLCACQRVYSCVCVEVTRKCASITACCEST